MRHIYLIARREYLSYVATIGFWISLAMIPVFLLFGMALPSLLDHASPVRNFAVIDTDGRYEAAIDRVFATQHTDQIREYLTTMIKLEGDSAELGAALQALDAGQPESDIRQILGPQRSAGLSAMRINFRKVPAPGQTPEELRPYLLGKKTLQTPRGPEELHSAILIGPAKDGAVKIEYWSANINDSRLQDRVRRAVADQMQIDEFAKAGIDVSLVERITELHPDITSLSPEKAADEAEVTDADKLPFIIGVVFGFMLWSIVFSVANMLLTSVIEEKSNKILDSLLCSAPLRSILVGKLFGVAAVSFTLLAGWASAALISAAVVSTVTGASTGTMGSIFSVAVDPGLLLPFFIYFVFGYLMFGSVFLALGSLCETLQEAQTLMTPMIFLMMVPMMALIFAMQDPESPVLVVLSWIPLFTPYIMMARLPTDPPMIEIVGTSVLMLVTTALILFAAGKVFQAGAMHQAGADYFKQMFQRWLPGKRNLPETTTPPT
jgi:ABC-2 type transport system permease protein